MEGLKEIKEITLVRTAGEATKINTSPIIRVKKVIWKDSNGWQLKLRGKYSYAVHYCQFGMSRGGAQPMNEKDERCSKCNAIPNTDMIGLWRLHNWDRLVG